MIKELRKKIVKKVNTDNERGARRAIIEDGVHIPDGLLIGFDLDHDRRHYKVTGAGVVIVANTRGQIEPFATKRAVVFKTNRPSRRIRAAQLVA